MYLSSAVRLREVSALERAQLQRYKYNLAGTKFAVRYREVSGLESVHLERVDCITVHIVFNSIKPNNNETFLCTFALI